MMLINFSVSNYLSFKEKNSFSLLKTTLRDKHAESYFKSSGRELLKSSVIFGANASGKSNFLKALFFFRQFIVNSLHVSLDAPFAVKPFLFNTATESAPSVFEIELGFNNDLYTYGFKIFSTTVVEEWLKSDKKNTIFKRTGQRISSTNKDFAKDFKDLRKNTRENVLFISVLASYNWKLAVEFVENIKDINILLPNHNTMDYSFRKYKEDKIFQEKMMDLISESDFGVNEILCSEKDLPKEEALKMFPPQLAPMIPQSTNLRELSTMHDKFDVAENLVGTTSLDFFEESQGTQNMFSLSGPIVDTLENGKILFVDEMDASLHPMLCQFILSLFNSKEFNKKNAQLVFTTHDLSTLDDQFLRRDQIWFTEKNSYGVSRIFSLADLGERKGVSFLKRYLEGRYGAIPYIKTLESIR